MGISTAFIQTLVTQITDSLGNIGTIPNTWISSNIDTADPTNYYFLSFIEGSTQWRINRLNKTTYVSDYAVGGGDINIAWTNRTSLTYTVIY